MEIPVRTVFNKDVSWRSSARLASAVPGKLRAFPMRAAILTCALLSALGVLPAALQSQDGPTETLHGHVLGILSRTTLLPRDPAKSTEPLTLTVLLKLSDEAGFDAYRKDVHNPKSPNFRKRISRSDFTARFGPTQQSYDSVLAYLEQKGFTLVAGSTTRRTLTVRGTRAQAEDAFHVSIDDHQLGKRTFRAISTDPAVPKALAPLIHGITGFSNLARWRPGVAPSPETTSSLIFPYNGLLTPAGSTNAGGLPPGLDGSGQTIGLIEFDNYVDSDVSNTLANAGLPPNLIQQVSRFPIAGGTSPSGCKPLSVKCGTSEVLTDIAAALGVAPGASIIVFEAPNGTDFWSAIELSSEQIYLAGGGSTTTGSLGGILSLSWTQCEAEISQSDAEGVDSILGEWNAAGITFFSITGDSGSTCTSADGSLYPNSISFPPDAASAVAVGGTTLLQSSVNSYQGESWWYTSLATVSQSGGYGVSQYIFPALPDYQSAFTNVYGRSVPDVSIAALPGITFCQAYGGNSPNCLVGLGGTSQSAPLWAGVWALARQAQADGEGVFDVPLGLYQHPEAFHSPSSMLPPANDFYHVGIGSPDITSLISKACVLKVDSVSPGSGPWKGGTKVTIRGKGFIGVKKVTFGGVDATHVTIYSDSKLTADSPAAIGNQVDIQVVTPAGPSQKVKQDLFAYGPMITNVSPASGSVEGGTKVTVKGKAFSLHHTAFEFGGSPATDEACSSSDECTMTAPSHDAGTADVMAKTNAAESESAYFTFVPSITRINPKEGALEGTQVTVKGLGFNGQSNFYFGGSEVSPGTCASSTSCTMTAPYHNPGQVDVTVETNGAKSSPTLLTPRFTYFAPMITKISPSIGPLVGGQPVTLMGHGFYTLMTVMFGSTIATWNNGEFTTQNVNCSSDVLCTAYSPAGTGSVYVTASLAGYTSTKTQWTLYTYAVFPSVTLLSPYNGPVTGGITVTITGTNFSTTPGGTTFQFGSLPATNVTCASSTQCTVTAPVRAATAGYLSVPVTATVNGFTSVTSFLFEFGTPPPHVPSPNPR